MPQVEITIIHGPNLEVYFVGAFDLQIIPRTGEYISFDIGCDYDPVIFEVKYIYHKIEPKCSTEIHVSPLDEKVFEYAKAEAGFRWGGA